MVHTAVYHGSAGRPSSILLTMSDDYEFTVTRHSMDEEVLVANRAEVENGHLLFYDTRGNVVAGYQPGEWDSFTSEAVEKDA